jgi:hypothetical protein
MTLLRFDGIGPKRSGEKKTLSIILGAGALVATIALGSTLAANINLNGGGTVEFGQGVAQTTACDDNIFITPEAPFINDAQNATFLFNAFSVTDISEACFGKTFTIKIYKDGQDGPLPFYNTNGTIYSEIRVKNDNGIFSFVGGGLTADDIQAITGGFYVTIGAGTLPSFSLVSGEDIDRITIESSDTVFASPIGQIGPGGGTIFYYSEEAFTSTGSVCDTDCHYLEVAPANWSVHNNEDYFVYSDERIESQPRTTGNESGLADERVGWRIGVGMANTLMVALENANSTSGKIASRNALAYAGANNTVGQWFVPSMNELNELCKFANSLPSGSLRNPCTGGTLRDGFSTAWYWSSSEWGSPEDERASMFKMMMTFYGGQYTMNFQSAELQLRPIRAF